MKPGNKFIPRKWVANQVFSADTMSPDRKDGSYVGSSASKPAPVAPSIFVASANRSNSPLK